MRLEFPNWMLFYSQQCLGILSMSVTNNIRDKETGFKPPQEWRILQRECGNIFCCKEAKLLTKRQHPNLTAEEPGSFGCLFNQDIDIYCKILRWKLIHHTARFTLYRLSHGDTWEIKIHLLFLYFLYIFTTRLSNWHVCLKQSFQRASVTHSLVLRTIQYSSRVTVL